jgi:hypothetical protein
MKNLKSLLAIVMVLVIGACLTGCQSAEEKAESERLVFEETQKAANAEFLKWFDTPVARLVETRGVVIGLSLSDYAAEKTKTLETATLTIGETDYLFSDFGFQSIGTMANDEIVKNNIGLGIDFNTATVREYDLLTLTIIDKSDGAITLTYYPDV